MADRRGRRVPRSARSRARRARGGGRPRGARGHRRARPSRLVRRCARRLPPTSGRSPLRRASSGRRPPGRLGAGAPRLPTDRGRRGSASPARIPRPRTASAAAWRGRAPRARRRPRRSRPRRAPRLGRRCRRCSPGGWRGRRRRESARRSCAKDIATQAGGARRRAGSTPPDAAGPHAASDAPPRVDGRGAGRRRGDGRRACRRWRSGRSPSSWPGSRSSSRRGAGGARAPEGTDSLVRPSHGRDDHPPTTARDSRPARHPRSAPGRRSCRGRPRGSRPGSRRALLTSRPARLPDARSSELRGHRGRDPRSPAGVRARPPSTSASPRTVAASLARGAWWRRSLRPFGRSGATGRSSPRGGVHDARPGGSPPRRAPDAAVRRRRRVPGCPRRTLGDARRRPPSASTSRRSRQLNRRSVPWT